jgi:hypothetical protein
MMIVIYFLLKLLAVLYSEVVQNAYVLRYTGFQIDMANFEAWYDFYCHSTDRICHTSWQLICCVFRMSIITYLH